MFKVIALCMLMFATCRADLPVPAPAPPQVYCGYIPEKLYSCVHIPSLHLTSAPKKCGRTNDQCERLTCVGREASWLANGSVNIAKLSENLEQFKKEHPDWSAAIDKAKTNCLVQNLPAQGYFLNCPAYDVTFCMLATFIKNVPPTLWPSTPDCVYPRQYAESCPVCPEECFAAAVPTGSCNSCRALPRSP